MYERKMLHFSYVLTICMLFCISPGIYAQSFDDSIKEINSLLAASEPLETSEADLNDQVSDLSLKIAVMIGANNSSNPSRLSKIDVDLLAGNIDVSDLMDKLEKRELLIKEDLKYLRKLIDINEKAFRKALEIKYTLTADECRQKLLSLKGNVALNFRILHNTLILKEKFFKYTTPSSFK